ncbi:transposase [Phenylobacterium immobile]|uniref:transposase n=1 Tax=Phenylobacterium immobile TaxID=21 RepID=UPI000A5254B6|nr:transposase [Phenylobacterium immobile]
MISSALAFEQSCFRDEAAAYVFVESLVWPSGPVCPRCGEADLIQSIRPNPAKRVRYGLKNCVPCNRQFTVRQGMIFENSKLPLTTWLKAIFLALADADRVNTAELREALGVTSVTARLVAKRLELATADHGLDTLAPLTAERCC